MRTILFDATRLFMRASLGSPTGIDRVTDAYARWLLNRPEVELIPVCSLGGVASPMSRAWFENVLLARTPRATVETYLLYRAAELTIQNGYDWFEPVERHTDRDKRTFVDPDPFYGPGYGWGYFRPSWSFYGPRGWGPWGPYGYGWGGGATVSTVQEFQATAEIAMGHGAKPTDNPRAMDAREVMTNLGPKIQRPVPGK